MQSYRSLQFYQQQHAHWVSPVHPIRCHINTNNLYSGNAFALFLKSQRKWDNPPLQDDHRDTFRELCKKHNYDAAKYIAHL